MRILCIGNSFSVDATRYLYSIARAGGVKMDIVNLYVSGCSLERHYRNMLSEKPAYELYFNGIATGFFVSLKDALLSRSWDIVTMQQASGSSAKEDTYEPYAQEIAAYVRKCAPKAKILIHQTWAYEDGSNKLLNVAGYETPGAMLADVKKSYVAMCQAVGAAGIIPSGEMFQAVLQQGIEKVHRDTFHATKGFGRYALGLLWYRVLTGNTVADNTFCDFDEPVTDEEVRIAKSFVDTVTPIFSETVQ